jgi:hypothetical protein
MSRWTSWNKPGRDVRPSFAIAPNFQCKGSWADRLLVAEGEGWRSPSKDELDSLTPEAPAQDGTACCSLISIPVHLRERFWSMLNDQVAEGTGNFDLFSEDMTEFLTFKGLSPPPELVCELLVQETNGKVDTGDVWALMNFGDDPLTLAWPGLRLRLTPGDGCLLGTGPSPDVVPPETDNPNVLFAIRKPAE